MCLVGRGGVTGGRGGGGGGLREGGFCIERRQQDKSNAKTR